MKDHRVLSPGEEVAAEEELFNGVLQLKNISECRAFFEDLCTPAELQAMKDRWSVAERLAEGRTYREIHELTGVSVTTIGRVSRYLSSGSGGYQTILKRLGK
ncbi:MAG: YerC/YecD family TrpR-related protein [Gammaproteobacteria bacterium]|jgi:TrpR-related protein YerC/YecD|nr:YerC/YecD family TrpR-related protein [Gammaproteobacteria bacterium]